MAVISGLTILFMMLSSTIDATARYLLNRPLAGVLESNEAALVICVFMGLAWTQIERGHIRVMVLYHRLSPRAKSYMNLIVWVIALVFVAILMRQTGIGALESFSTREFRWGSVQMPIWWVKALIPFGCGMLAIQLLLDIWEEIERIRGKLPQIAD